MPATATLDFALRFPPLPRTVSEVSRLLAEGESDSKALIEVISADPSLSASILRQINSVFYGLRGNVATVERAVLLLGFQTTCDVALTAGIAGLRGLLRTPEQLSAYRRLIGRSLGAAHFAQVLVEEARLGESASLAFTTGLLSTSGQFVLLYNRPDAYAALVRDHGGVPPAGAEREAFGADHAAVARAAAAAWNLPEAVEQVLSGYLMPGQLPEPLRPLAWALRVSLSATDQLCLSANEEGEAPLFIPPPALIPLAQQSEASAEHIAQRVFEERERASAFMAMVLDG